MTVFYSLQGCWLGIHTIKQDLPLHTKNFSELEFAKRQLSAMCSTPLSRLHKSSISIPKTTCFLSGSKKNLSFGPTHFFCICFESREPLQREWREPHKWSSTPSKHQHFRINYTQLCRTAFLDKDTHKCAWRSLWLLGNWILNSFLITNKWRAIPEKLFFSSALP